MPTDSFRFGGGVSESTMHPAIAVAMALLLALILFLPRKHLIVPVLFGSLLIPTGHVLVVGGAHLTPTRIIALFGCIRMLAITLTSHIPLFVGGFNPIDKAFILWALFRSLSVMLLWMEQSAVINQVGVLWSSIGMYLVLRFLIHDGDGIRTAIRLLALVAVINAVGMLAEQTIHQNVFGLLGGVRDVPEIREGKIRSQGTFQHSILAGCFGATLLPLFLWLWKNSNSKITAVLGLVSSTIITFTSASSTPLLAYVSAIVAVCFWRLRRQMRLIRWGVVLTLVALHLVMKSPVWWLISRIDLVGGSSGYHRAKLVDSFIMHFGDWWLIGANNYEQWGDDMWDQSNQFVAEGEEGGLITFVWFLAIIIRCFRRLGLARTAVRHDSRQEWSLWLLSAALSAHIVGFFGVSYWDQTSVAWATLLVIISAATTTLVKPFGRRTDQQNLEPVTEGFAMAAEEAAHL
jgi:hypothetical protein